jgi:lysozyme
VNNARTVIAALSLSAAAFGSIVVSEGYSESAIIPVAGDVPTIGFGTTGNVKPGDHITPPQAVLRALQDINRYEGALKQCVHVPLHQYEYDAYISLAYNIGPTSFCNSTLVRKLNAGSYDDACSEILRWDRFKGQPLKGLTVRRQREYQTCIGESYSLG